MKAHPKQITECPLAAVDQRLADSHRFWHQAEAAYFDPDGFRLGAQSAIQTLRSVTFILQKNKGAIPGFDQWYDGWRKRLGADELMRWIVDARNRIEKEGDLEAHSYVRAEMLGVGCNGDQGLGRDLEQQVIDDRLVVIGDVGDRSRQGEDNMEIGRGQQFGLAVGQPLLGSDGLALRTMPVAAGCPASPRRSLD